MTLGFRADRKAAAAPAIIPGEKDAGKRANPGSRPMRPQCTTGHKTVIFRHGRGAGGNPTTPKATLVTGLL